MLCVHLLFRLWAHQVQEKQMWQFKSYPISTTIFQSRGLWLLLILIRWEREHAYVCMCACARMSGVELGVAGNAWKFNGNFSLYENLIIGTTEYQEKLMNILISIVFFYWFILGLSLVMTRLYWGKYKNNLIFLIAGGGGSGQTVEKPIRIFGYIVKYLD